MSGVSRQRLYSTEEDHEREAIIKFFSDLDIEGGQFHGDALLTKMPV